ncbi:MAG: hypothetical protein PHH82_04150 [Candidatus ainarchaeum sp.]|nr:hypothetical protein [Candidatus ainarchaeum sp.]
MAGNYFLFFSVFFVLLMSLGFGFTITDCNQVLSASGTYYLQNDLNMADTNGLEGMNTYCLEVTGDDITIDCNGFRIKNEDTVMNTMGILGKAAAPGDSVDNLNIVGCTATKLHYLIYLLEVDTKDLNVYNSSFEAVGLQTLATFSECGSYFEGISGNILTRNDLNTYWDLTDNNACLEIRNSSHVQVDFDTMWSNALFGTDNNSSHIGILVDDNSAGTTFLDLNISDVYTGLSTESTISIINSKFFDINDLYFSDYNISVLNTKVDDQNLIWFNKYIPSATCPTDFNSDYDNAMAYVFYDCDYPTEFDVNGLELTDNVVSGVGSLPPFYFYDVNNITIHDFNVQLNPVGSNVTQSVVYYKQHGYAPVMGVGCAGGLITPAIYGYPVKIRDTYINNPNPNFAYLTTIYTIGYGERFYDVNVDGNIYAATSVEGLGSYSAKDLNFNGDFVWSFSNYDSDNNCPNDVNSDYNSGATYAFISCAAEQVLDSIVFDSSYTLFPNTNTHQVYSYGSDVNLSNIDFNGSDGSVKIGYGTLKLQDSNILSSATTNIYLCNSNFTAYDSNVYASLGYPLLFDFNVIFDINNSSFFGDNTFKNDPTFLGFSDCVSGDIKNSNFDINGTGDYSLSIANGSDCTDSLDFNNNTIYDATVFSNYIGNFLDNNYDDSDPTPADFNDSIDANFYNNTFEIIDFYDAVGTVNFYDNLLTTYITGTSSINIVDANLTATIYDNNIYNNFDCSTCGNLMISGDSNGQYSAYNNIFYIESDANYFDISADSLDITFDLNTDLNCTGSRNLLQGTCMGGNYWTAGTYLSESDICEDRNSYYGICDTNYAPTGQSTFYDYHPLTDMLLVDPGVSPTNVEYTDGTDSVDFNLTTSFYDMYYSAGDYYKDGVNMDVNLNLYYALVSDWTGFDYKLRKQITLTNNDSVQKNSFTLDLNFEDYTGLDINPYQISFSSEVNHFTTLNTDLNALKVEVALADFLATGADTNIYVYYDYKWYDKEDDVNTTYPNFYSWKSSSLYDFNGDFYSVEPANSTYSVAFGTSNPTSDSDIQIFLFNETSTGRVSSSEVVEIDGNAVGYGGIYNSNDGNYLVYGKLDSNAAAYLLDGNDFSLVTTLDFNYTGHVNEGLIGSDGNYYLLVGRDTNATVYKFSPDLLTIYDSNLLTSITVEKDIIEADGNILTLGVTALGGSVIYDLNSDLDVSSSLAINGVLMVEMEEDEDGNIIYVGREDGSNSVMLKKYDRDMSTLISDKNYSGYTIDNTDYIDLEMYDGNTYYNGSSMDYNYILRFSNRVPAYSWILYLDSDLNIVARGYYLNTVFTEESHIENNKQYVGTTVADVYTFELDREQIESTEAYDEPTLLTNGTIEDYCSTTNLAEQVGEDCNYSANFSGFTNDTNYVMMMYSESRTASQLFRKNMNYFFFSVPTINTGGSTDPGGDGPGGDGGVPDANEPEIDVNDPIIPDEPDEPHSINNPDWNKGEPIIDFKPEIFLGESQGVGIFKDKVCVVGAKIKVISPSGKVSEYVMDEKCKLEFIPTEEGNYIMEITLPDGTKIIKQFKVKPKSKVGLFDDGTTVWIYIVGGIVILGSIGYIVYRFFIKDRMRGLGDV